MFEGKCGAVAMAEEELNKQDQKESQSEVIRAIRDVELAIDRIRESFSLIFGMLENRAHEWIDNYLKYYNMKKEEFDLVLDKYVNKKLFKKINGIWEPKFIVGKNFAHEDSDH